MKQICDAAIKLLQSGESFVQATILKSHGSTPRGTGACMIITGDGSICGSVGGGALEAGIIKAAPEVMGSKRARVINVVLDGSDAAAMGVICGGTATVLIDFISGGDKANLEFFTALRNALRSNSQARIMTVPPAVDAPAARNQCLIMPEGPPLGAEGCDPEIIRAVKGRHSGYDVYTRLDDREVYFHRIGTDGIVYIFGAGHCGEKLAPVLSKLGFGVVAIDDREEFANAARFPDADEILVPASMDMPFSEIEWGEDSYIVIVTRGHVHDELVLRGALKTSAGYVGMIGSRKKRDAVYARMMADGYSQSDIDRVHCPIGMQIEAETPEEIAISIAGELIAARAGRRQLTIDN